MKVTITRISPGKSGVSEKTGNPWRKVGIQTNQHGEKYINGFANGTTDNWKVGDTVDIDVEEHSQYGLQFKMKKAAVSADDFVNLEQRVSMLEQAIKANGQSEATEQKILETLIEGTPIQGHANDPAIPDQVDEELGF